jgi:hypothetical protein
LSPARNHRLGCVADRYGRAEMRPSRSERAGACPTRLTRETRSTRRTSVAQSEARWWAAKRWLGERELLEARTSSHTGAGGEGHAEGVDGAQAQTDSSWGRGRCRGRRSDESTELRPTHRATGPEACRAVDGAADNRSTEPRRMGYATLRVGMDLLETLGAGQEPISIERNKRSSSDADDDEPRRSRLLTL